MEAISHPGPRSAAMLAELRQYVLADPWPFCIDLENCQGMYLATVDGQQLFDWAGGYASKWIAHNHPRLFETDYLRRLSFAANHKLANPDFLTPECLAYYRALHEVAPRCMKGGKLEVYTVNSGAEAVENMMKYFINLHDAKPQKSKTARRFIYFDQAFHGRTVFALNITELSHAPVITQHFHGLVRGNIQIPFPAIHTDETPERNRQRTDHALELVQQALQDHGDEIVAIITEPIQGAGGHRVAEAEFFQGLSRLAEAHDVFFGFDEVQTAGGQTGEFFMADQLDLPYPPHAIAAAKKLANGVLYMRSPMIDVGVLDSTWGGSLADMVRFCQELEIVRSERLIEQVPEKSAHLIATLKALQQEHPDKISNVRGSGLYQGFSLATPKLKSALLQQALQQENLLLLGAGQYSVRLRPNLHVSEEDIDQLGMLLGKVLAGL